MPVTPTQMAGACVEAALAGASVVHIHVRDPKTGANSRSPELFKEVVDRVRSSGQDVVINLTCGNGAFFLPETDDESRRTADSDVVSAWDRMRHLEQCLPEIASLDITTGNQVEGAQEFVYLNIRRELCARWRSVTVTWASSPSWKPLGQAAIPGGNVRVGLEDDLYLSRGVFATNGQLVDRAHTIIESIGRGVASPAETRQILGLRERP